MALPLFSQYLLQEDDDFIALDYSVAKVFNLPVFISATAVATVYMKAVVLHCFSSDSMPVVCRTERRMANSVLAYMLKHMVLSPDGLFY